LAIVLLRDLGSLGRRLDTLPVTIVPVVLVRIGVVVAVRLLNAGALDRLAGLAFETPLEFRFPLRVEVLGGVTGMLVLALVIVRFGRVGLGAGVRLVIVAELAVVRVLLRARLLEVAGGLAGVGVFLLGICLGIAFVV